MRLRPKACAASTKAGRSLWNGIWGQMQVVSFWGKKAAFVVFSSMVNGCAIDFLPDHTILMFVYIMIDLSVYMFLFLLKPSSLLCTLDCDFIFPKKQPFARYSLEDEWQTYIYINNWFHSSTKIQQHQSFLSVCHAARLSRRNGPWIYPFWFGIPTSGMEATGKYVEINTWIIA